MDLKAVQFQRSSGILKSQSIGELPNYKTPNEYYDTIVKFHGAEVHNNRNTNK